LCEQCRQLVLRHATTLTASISTPWSGQPRAGGLPGAGDYLRRSSGSVGNGVVHRAVSGLGDRDVVGGVRRGGLRRGGNKGLGRPGDRARGAVLQALLVVERGQV